MKKALAAFFITALLIVSTIGCAPALNKGQLANIEDQLLTLSLTLAITKQELALTRQALAEAQEQTSLLQQQTPIAANLVANTVATIPRPTIISFNATPTTITIGQASNLQWNVTGADSVSINPSIGNVSYAGVRVVYPTTSTTYILTATNSNASVTAYATVTIPEVYPSPSSPYYSGYPYYTPSYTFPPVSPTYHPLPTPPTPRHAPPPVTNNSTRPHPPFPPVSPTYHPVVPNYTYPPAPPTPAQYDPLSLIPAPPTPAQYDPLSLIPAPPTH